VILTPHPHVRVDPNVLGGSPFVVGSRVPVRRLWAFYRNGTSVERILRRYPQLCPAKVFDALAFALDNQEVVDADLAREEALLGARAAELRGPSAQIELPFAAADVAATGPRGAAGARTPSAASKPAGPSKRRR
jgi:uncharacterized protein (DUF433 family)